MVLRLGEAIYTAMGLVAGGESAGGNTMSREGSIAYWLVNCEIYFTEWEGSLSVQHVPT